MAPPLPLLLLLLLAAVATCCAGSSYVVYNAAEDGSSKTTLRPSVISCSTAGNYTDGSQYHVNLYNLLSAIPMAAANNGGFFNGTSGTAGDQVFGLFMCYTGYSGSECLGCLNRAPDRTMQLCPHSRKVRAIYNACTLRYSNEPFSSVADLSIAYHEQLTIPYGDSYKGTVLVGNIVDTTVMRSTRFELIRRLTERASRWATRIAEGRQQFTDTQFVAGAAQCMRNLPASECTRCLSNYTDLLPRFFPNNSSGVIKGYSCYLGYAIFTDKPSALQLEPYPWNEEQEREQQDREEQKREEQERERASERRKRQRIVGIIAAVVAGAVALVLCLIGLSVCFLLYRQRRRKVTAARLELEQPLKDTVYFRGKSVDQDELEQGTGPRQFTYDELMLATDGFSDGNKLGEGGFGSVYRGFLGDANLHIAVKQVSKSSRQGWKEFVSEVRIINRLRHRNLVQLLGWFHGGDDDLLLVYELMPHGSLDSQLYKPGHLLPWSVRYEVGLGLGSALLYLHEETEQRVVHRDIKPSNMMLDASFNAKLGDFGLARLIVGDGRGSCTTGVAGTLGYMDPKCVFEATASVESDVYSFGVVLLEIACGRRPAVDDGDGAVIHLVQWAWKYYGGRAILEAADARLDGEFDGQEMERMLVVGLWCSHPDRSMRPSIRQAIGVLRFEAPLPSLPSKMPIATYVLAEDSSGSMRGSTGGSDTSTTHAAAREELD
ncbi:L-type lectin-domain containing receptor kinase IX.1 [Brachypodium distachyon]|uniref:Protein kinase domain-containing protein n=1 Tax=Brachypodium distachyon TaxID=15368 RepID=I1IGL6_BRADI|nr:L-type lectin-domain containing receptor kinase IX.1 [Brachypodium distachyon]KQJ85881.2 hypothetical protein BRADI_4g02220v3 [Brachypodium distachyon]|eukprot:XP_010237046.1 L-type lectin-domain containing receptor kinase IX.1 [Brachypodium distachyon]